jgi:hypothetical protein
MNSKEKAYAIGWVSCLLYGFLYDAAKTLGLLPNIWFTILLTGLLYFVGLALVGSIGEDDA